MAYSKKNSFITTKTLVTMIKMVFCILISQVTVLGDILMGSPNKIRSGSIHWLFVCIILLVATSVQAQRPREVDVEIDTIFIQELQEKMDDVITIDRNTMFNYPSTFQDPARAMTQVPGVAMTNDGNNEIVYRGLNPIFYNWQLFGGDILNPNHLTNAGVDTDLPTSNGGGVNMFQASVLKRFSWEAQPSNVQNVLGISGTANLEMADKITNYVDLNFVGLESGINWSRKNRENTYFTARYSFTGLLESFGVNLGDEKVNYFDFHFYHDFIKTNDESLRMFISYGASSNQNIQQNPPSTFKDVYDIQYNDNKYIMGLDYKKSYFNSELTNTFIILTASQTRQKSILYSNNEVYNSFERASVSNHLKYKLKMYTNFINLGLRAQFFSRYYYSTFDFSFEYVTFRLNPYVETTVKNVFHNLDLDAGVSFMVNEGIFPNVYLGLRYKLNDKSQISLKYRYQNTNVHDYISQYYSYYDSNNNFIANVSELGYEYKTPKFKFNTHVFYYYNPKLYSIAEQMGGTVTKSYIHQNILSIPAIDYSNLAIGQFPIQLISNGLTGINYGMDAYIDYQISPRWQANARAYIGRSGYRYPGGEYFHSKYDIGKSYGFTLFYDQKKEREGSAFKNWKFGFSSIFRGGFWYQDFNENQQTGNNLYDRESSFHNQYKDYFRVDGRVVYSFSNRGKLKHRLSLDIQNLTNRLNDGYYYYDSFQNSINLKSQLGMIPVFSYRIEW